MLSILRTLRLISSDCYLSKYRRKEYEFKEDTCIEPPLHASNILIEVSQLRDTKKDSHYQAKFIRLLYNGRSIRLQ